MAKRQTAITFETVREIGLALPDVTEEIARSESALRAVEQRLSRQADHLLFASSRDRDAIVGSGGARATVVPNDRWVRATRRRAELDSLLTVFVLVDGAPVKGDGILLQIFTETVIGPIFFEIIQRKGNEGFGEGNFGALFRSRDYQRVLRRLLVHAHAVVLDLDQQPVAGPHFVRRLGGDAVELDATAFAGFGGQGLLFAGEALARALPAEAEGVVVNLLEARARRQPPEAATGGRYR